ncbi:uncharacterized protein TNCV_1158471 [Trichonephila clavipes]|nr:uncharacterized protein TNCV_1158471 [Trichonephila clavipes]
MLEQCSVVWFFFVEGELNAGSYQRMGSVYSEHCVKDLPLRRKRCSSWQSNERRRASGRDFKASNLSSGRFFGERSSAERESSYLLLGNLSEGRFVLGTFRSDRILVLNRSRQNDRLHMMLVLVHIDITPPHTPLPVFRRICERTIPYSWRACKQLRHLCETALRSNGLFAPMFDGLIASILDGLVAFAVDRWCHDSSARRVRFISRPGHQCRKEGSFWVPSVPNECKYLTDHAKTIVSA